MTDGEGTVSQVLAGIAAAEDAGFAPIKINTVVQRSRNFDQILPLVDRFRGTGHVLRFIEFMDVGSTNGWRLDEVVPALEVLGLIAEHHPIEPVAPAYRGEVAERWRFLDGSGEIGVIASVTQPFCGDCHRARLTASGEFFTCLFAEHGTDLRSILRGPAASAEPATTSCAKSWSAAGGCATTATPRSDRAWWRCRRTRSRCRTSEAEGRAPPPLAQRATAR